MQYVIVVTQGRVHCLICMHGRGRVRTHQTMLVLQLICNTSGEAAVFICKPIRFDYGLQCKRLLVAVTIVANQIT